MISAARAINAIFSRWRIRANERWNISGDICSGIASDSDTPLDYSPGIKCDCSYNSSTLCHVYSLYALSLSLSRLCCALGLNLVVLCGRRVSSMSDWDSSSNVVGELPEELWSLTYLTNLYVFNSIPHSSNLCTKHCLSEADDVYVVT